MEAAYGIAAEFERGGPVAYEGNATPTARMWSMRLL